LSPFTPTKKYFRLNPPSYRMVDLAL